MKDAEEVKCQCKNVVTKQWTGIKGGMKEDKTQYTNKGNNKRWGNIAYKNNKSFD